MIFLAVTLGFFAENLREHFADSNKEKIYVNGLTRDLKADSSFINIMVDFINNDPIFNFPFFQIFKFVSRLFPLYIYREPAGTNQFLIIVNDFNLPNM